MQKVLLSSGGMDSMLLAHEPDLQDAIHVFVNIRQKYLTKEQIAARKVADSVGAQFVEVKTLAMGQYEHPTGIIPFRNAEMILCAAQYGQAIYLGVIADEINSDKSVEFCNAMKSVLNISHQPQYWTEGKNYEIRTPFRKFSKSELVHRYFERGGKMSTLLESVSCYDAGARHCGRCPSCFKRWVALISYEERNEWRKWGFVVDPAKWKTQEYWQSKCQDYSVQRATEIFHALTCAGV